jgi:hypothetical protein
MLTVATVELVVKLSVLLVLTVIFPVKVLRPAHVAAEGHKRLPPEPPEPIVVVVFTVNANPASVKVAPSLIDKLLHVCAAALKELLPAVKLQVPHVVTVVA